MCLWVFVRKAETRRKCLCNFISHLCMQECGFAHSEKQKNAYMKMYLLCTPCPNGRKCTDFDCGQAHTRKEQEGLSYILSQFRLRPCWPPSLSLTNVCIRFAPSRPRSGHERVRDPRREGARGQGALRVVCAPR